MIDFALDSRIFLNNEFDIAMQELDILFNTENTELIGNPQFGTNFEQFLWQLNPSPNELKRYINEKISGTMFLSRYTTNIEVNIVNGNYRNIYIVDISVTAPDGTTQERKYQFR